MRKWIPLIGLLTYSSVGWSKELMMECFFDWGPSKGIMKLNTSESDTSDKLFMYREDGEWVEFPCSISVGEEPGCKKGDDSVIVTGYSFDYRGKLNGSTKTVYDFKFLQHKTTVYSLDGRFVEETSLRCEKR